MDKKNLLIELCKNLQEELIERKETNKERTVVFFSGFKPYNYVLPHIHIGTTKSLPNEIEMAWFVEIWLDEICIFRQSYIPRESEDIDIVEQMLITRVFRDIFTYGIMSSKEFINKMNKNV